MKRILLLIIFSLFISGITYAQKGFHVGLQGGGGLVFILNQNTYGGPEYKYAPKMGYMFGAEAGMNFTDHFGIQLEANMTRQGQFYEDNTQAGAILRDVTLKYTQFPVMLKYSGGNYFTRFSAMFGPYWGYLNSARITYKVNEVARDTLGTGTDFTERFDVWDMGLALDIGSDFKLVDNLYASTSLRFTYGLKDINAENFRIPSLSNNKYEKSTNGYGMVLFGIHYLFGGGQKEL